MRILVFLSLFLSGVICPTAFAQSDGSQRGHLRGDVVDAETGEPLPGAAVRLGELGRGQATDGDGSFLFEHLPVRTVSVSVQYLGYVTSEQRVQIRAGETVSARFELQASAVVSQGIVVTGLGRERSVAEAYRPTAVVHGRDLERSLETSLAETLRRIPGLNAVYNGPAATRPTIRGMGGDRLLVLEDGQRVGDLSSTASDHAVAVDPVSAERIEVVRGPAGLLYGSNALGGVINVWREEVPRTIPSTVTGTFTATGQSVNSGIAGHGLVHVPLGPFALRAELTGRTAGDTRTPLGVLPSSGLTTYSGTVGLSHVADWGYLGAAYRYYDSAYGVPGTFNDETIPGAHEGGVDIEMQRHVGRLKGAWLSGIGPFSVVELDANLTYYRHVEIEVRGTDTPDLIGAEFSLVSAGGSLIGRHGHELGHAHVEGAVGISGSFRDLIARGGYTGTRSANELTLAAFLFEEFQWESLRLQLGGRFDYQAVSPYNTSPIRVGGRQIPVTARSFGNVSASLALLYDLHPGWTVGASVARAFRSPAIEELYSDGPHLADYSYNIGNPELGSEIGHGVDAFLRISGRRFFVEAGAYVNHVSGFIYYRPTGELDPRFRRFPVFQAASSDALFLGTELQARLEIYRHIVLEGTASYVHASRVEDNDPLPMIPPLSGNIEVRYDDSSLFASVGGQLAAPQHRTPGPIAIPDQSESVLPEQPTDGFALLDAAVGYRFAHGPLIHSITLRGRNLTNAVWRDHLSRIKDVAPQSGRDILLVYRIQF